MSELSQMLTHPFVETLGWSLIHFLWQGIIIAILTAAVLSLLRKNSAAMQYCVACVALMMMAAAPAVTVWTLHDAPPSVHETVTETDNAAATPEVSPNGSVITTRAMDDPVALSPGELPDAATGDPQSIATLDVKEPIDRLEQWLPVLVAAWLLSVTVLSLRLVLSLVRVSRLKTQGTTRPSSVILDRVSEITKRLQVAKPVRLAESMLVEVPTVIGTLKPLILLPASAITGLSAEQLDAILAHEIAHIRRHDYFVNLIQTIIETLLFYHPAVWWLSGRIRQERENCCDDIASELCENPIRYAEALVRMEELRSPAGGLAMAANGGSLKTRIRRLLGQSSHKSNTSWWIGGLVSLLIVVSLVVTLSLHSSRSLAEEPQPQQANENLEVSHSTPDEVDIEDETVPVTPASIADAMEESMRQYSTIDFSANILKSNDSLAETSKLTEEFREIEATIRYRADGKRFFAERDATGGDSNGSWIEGFDGTTHYHTDRGLLILGEESLTEQALSATNLLFSLNGRPTETLRFLRDENAKVVTETRIEGTTCQVIEVPFTRGDRSWTYRVTVAPERSSLPLVLTRTENGETTIRHTLSQLDQSGGKWYAKRIVTTRFNAGKVSRNRHVQITRFLTRPDVSPGNFAPPIVLGTNVLDRRVGYGWHEDPWWNDLKPWLLEKYGWPRPDLFELHSVGHYGDCPLEGKLAPPIKPEEWLAPNPGGWDRTERKLTLLYFYGGRLITPTPKWAAAINELHRRYRQYGFEVIGLAAATGTPDLPRQAFEEMSLSFPVGIDQKSDTGYGKTFLAYGLESYHGMFFVDHEELVRPCSFGEQSKVTVNGKEFTISHMERKVIDLLKKAGVENVEPQVWPSDIFDIKTHNEVMAQWRRLRKASPKDASVHGRVTFNGAPVSGASIKLQPSMTIMTSNTGHGFMLFPDRAAAITVPTKPDGTYEIRNLTKGEYKFTCTASGMKNRNRTILIGADLPQVNVDVALGK